MVVVVDRVSVKRAMGGGYFDAQVLKLLEYFSLKRKRGATFFR